MMCLIQMRTAIYALMSVVYVLYHSLCLMCGFMCLVHPDIKQNDCPTFTNLEKQQPRNQTLRIPYKTGKECQPHENLRHLTKDYSTLVRTAWSDAVNAQLLGFQVHRLKNVQFKSSLVLWTRRAKDQIQVKSEALRAALGTAFVEDAARSDRPFTAHIYETRKDKMFEKRVYNNMKELIAYIVTYMSQAQAEAAPAQASRSVQADQQAVGEQLTHTGPSSSAAHFRAWCDASTSRWGGGGRYDSLREASERARALGPSGFSRLRRGTPPDQGKPSSCSTREFLLQPAHEFLRRESGADKHRQAHAQALVPRVLLLLLSPAHCHPAPATRCHPPPATHKPAPVACPHVSSSDCARGTTRAPC